MNDGEEGAYSRSSECLVYPVRYMIQGRFRAWQIVYQDVGYYELSVPP